MGTSIMTKKYEEDNPANRLNYYINTPYIALLFCAWLDYLLLPLFVAYLFNNKSYPICVTLNN